MKKSGMGLGIFLLAAGIIWALVNFNVISLSVFSSIFTLWPLILVVIGINIIFRNKKAVKAVSWLVLLAVVIVYGHYHTGDASLGNENRVNKNVSVEKTADIRSGELALKLGGLKLAVDSHTDKLVQADFSKDSVLYGSDTSGGKTVVSFNSSSRSNAFIMNRGGLTGRISINPDIPWDIDINAGAIDGSIDLSGVSAGNINIKAGAAKLELILGDKADSCDVNISTGVSKLLLRVPEAVGVRMGKSGALINANLNDLDWVEKDDFYTSPNYDDSQKKINLKLTTGLCKIDIETIGP